METMTKNLEECRKVFNTVGSDRDQLQYILESVMLELS